MIRLTCVVVVVSWLFGGVYVDSGLGGFGVLVVFVTFLGFGFCGFGVWFC